MLRFSIASLLGLILLAALACAALLQPNAYYAAGFHLGLMAATFGSIYLAIFGQGTRRRLAGGFAVFVIGMQLWPVWFGDQVNLSERIVSAIVDRFGPQTNPYVNSSGGFYPNATTPRPYPDPFGGSAPNPDPFGAPSAPLLPPSASTPTTSDTVVTVTEADVQPLDVFSLRVIVNSLLSLVAGAVGILIAVVANRAEERHRTTTSAA